MTPLYIAKNAKHQTNRLCITDNLKVSYITKNKGTGRHIGGIPVMETDGWDKNRLQLFSKQDDTKSLHGYRDELRIYGLPAKAADVKSRLRLVRPQEAEVIAEVDGRIDVKLAELEALREERSAAVKVAWAKANVVQVKDLREIADARLAEVGG